MSVRVRHAVPADAPAWARQRCALWPDEDAADLHAEAAAHFNGGVRHLLAVLVAVDDADDLLGFAELNVRPYAEGCTSDRVAFLEGWHVDAAHRRRGIGAALIAAARTWAKAQGCTEFASDALFDNALAATAHRAVGFTEVEAIRCFRLDLES